MTSPPSGWELWDPTSKVRAFTVPDVDQMAFSPDGSHVLLIGEQTRIAKFGPGAAISNLHDVTVADSAHWLSTSEIVSWDGPHYQFDLLNVPTGVSRRIAPQVHGRLAPPDLSVDSPDAVLFTVPGSTRRVIWAVDYSTSGMRPYYEVNWEDTVTGNIVNLLSGEQFIVFDPTGKRFVVAPGRDLADYSHAKEVWTAPFQIGRSSTGMVKTIVGGLVWVTGADWRGGR